MCTIMSPWVFQYDPLSSSPLCDIPSAALSSGSISLQWKRSTYLDIVALQSAAADADRFSPPSRAYLPPSIVNLSPPPRISPFTSSQFAHCVSSRFEPRSVMYCVPTVSFGMYWHNSRRVPSNPKVTIRAWPGRGQWGLRPAGSWSTCKLRALIWFECVTFHFGQKPGPCQVVYLQLQGLFCQMRICPSM